MMKYIWSVLLLVAILLGNVLYIFQDVGFFHKQFLQLGSYERQESVMDEASVLMDYWGNDTVLVVSDVYTQAEKEHLYDVKEIVVVLCYVFIAISCWLLVFSAWLWWRGGLVASGLLHTLTRLVVGFVACAVVLFAVSWAAWDWFFDLFHRVFFVDNWLFAADSFLIQSYPWEFFRNAMVAILGRSLGMIGLVWLVLWGMKKLCNRA